MLSLYSFLESLNNRYERVPSKKNDDLGKFQAQQWVKSHQVDPDISLKIDKIDKYVNGIIIDLKNIPITSANYDLIKGHIEEIAMHSNDVRLKLWEKLHSCKGDKSLILKIIDSVGTLTTIYP
jgi:hypothetical protein